jgi:REP element-mobilizing transposase RayT
MTRPRSSLISLSDTPWYHVVSRCVRRAFLCGHDAHSGRCFDHRREWIVEWIMRLAAIFSLDVAAYAVMSNHYHIVLRVDVERAKNWSVEEVLQRWTQLFTGPVLVQRYLSADRERMKPSEIARVEQFAEEYRERFMNISWFMRILNQNIARQANSEDQVTGHFWEGRFKSQALLDETALLSAMAYVDLNPIRAGIAQTPEESDFTSIKSRIEGLATVEAAIDTQPDTEMTEMETESVLEVLEAVDVAAAVENTEIPATIPDNNPIEAAENTEPTTLSTLKKPALLAHLPQAPLMPFDATGRFRLGIPFSFEDYLELVDMVGRTIRTDKKGYIPDTTPKILVRLDIDTDTFIEYATRFLKEFGHAVGRPEALVAHAAKRQAKYLRGIKTARKVYGERKAA